LVQEHTLRKSGYGTQPDHPSNHRYGKIDPRVLANIASPYLRVELTVDKIKSNPYLLLHGYITKYPQKKPKPRHLI
jgi:hypothetical protein